MKSVKSALLVFLLSILGVAARSAPLDLVPVPLVTPPPDTSGGFAVKRPSFGGGPPHDDNGAWLNPVWQGNLVGQGNATKLAPFDLKNCTGGQLSGCTSQGIEYDLVGGLKSNLPVCPGSIPGHLNWYGRAVTYRGDLTFSDKADSDSDWDWE